jgi:hypothetical protein
MATAEGPYRGEGDTIREAAEDAARKIPTTVQNKEMLATIYAVLSGEHNPIHGWVVELGP